MLSQRLLKNASVFLAGIVDGFLKNLLFLLA